MGVPVIDIDGQIVVGFDVPRLESFLAQQRPRRSSLGISIADATSIVRKQGLPPVFGAYVGRVSTSSPGAKADLQPGDIIIELNLRRIHNADDLEKAMDTLVPGGRVSISYLRGSEERRAEVVV
ncbi:MAG: PDZ domain-containing protein [Chloroflexota bacterium]